jgi:PAS domain-containing protein
MTVGETKIKDLVKLTNGRSKTDRTLLYRHISHLIIQGMKANQTLEKRPEDTKILFELFDALSGQIDAEIRIELANDLSRLENPPEELTKRLALDEIGVAESILKSVPFQEKTLLDIINNTGKSHHLVITERKDLSQKLWQAIVDSREGVKLPIGEAYAKEEIPTQAPLIQFPRQTTQSHAGKRSPVDLFIPSNDKGPSLVERPVEPEMPPIPAFFLGRPPHIPEQKPNPETPPEPTTNMADDILWSVDRRGEITRIGVGVEKLFGQSHDKLIGQNLWQLMDMTANSDIYNAIIKRHPIRNLTVNLLGSGEQLQLIGHARFENKTGRFIGFDGTLKAVEEVSTTYNTRTSQIIEEKKPDVRTTQENHESLENHENLANPASNATTGHILAAHLSADASVPIQDMLEGIQRIARSARRNNDEAMLTDIRSVMSDCFKLRDMVEDTDRIARMFGGGESVGDESFDIFKVLNSCLDDDTTRHGNVLRFQLLPQTTNPMVRFSRNVLRQAFVRMLELARESNHNNHLIPIYVHPVNDSRLEVTIPLGPLTGDKSVDERDLGTDDRLKLGVVHRKRSGDPVMTASLGLSTLSGNIERLGGELSIIQNYLNSEPSGQAIAAGSVSIRLPIL